MNFVRNEVNMTPIVDNVFGIVKLAKESIAKYGADKVVNATIGSLYNEEGTIVALQSAFDYFNQIPDTRKAAYAASFTGNEDFRKSVYEWMTLNADVKLAHSVIATPGGSGAVSISMADILDKGECVIIPEIAWGSYTLMASMHGLTHKTYSLFDGDNFNIRSFKETCLEVMKQQNKLLVVINDPCHNPTGYSLTDAEWKEVIAFLNECGEKVPTVLLNDVAYIDYSYDIANSRKYLENFNNISDNVAVIVAFSCSKTMTSYGLRCGAALILAQSKEQVRNIEIVFEKTARAIWSNVNNGAMDTFTYIANDGNDAYMEEKGKYVALLKERSDIFKNEAKACNLPCYPYKEGFFVTLKIEDNKLRDKFHEALMDNLIFTVKVNKGIRVAVCSLSVEKCKGLAPRMKEILDNLK